MENSRNWTATPAGSTDGQGMRPSNPRAVGHNAQIPHAWFVPNPSTVKGPVVIPGRSVNPAATRFIDPISHDGQPPLLGMGWQSIQLSHPNDTIVLPGVSGLFGGSQLDGHSMLRGLTPPVHFGFGIGYGASWTPSLGEQPANVGHLSTGNVSIPQPQPSIYDAVLQADTHGVLTRLAGNYAPALAPTPPLASGNMRMAADQVYKPDERAQVGEAIVVGNGQATAVATGATRPQTGPYKQQGSPAHPDQSTQGDSLHFSVPSIPVEPSATLSDIRPADSKESVGSAGEKARETASEGQSAGRRGTKRKARTYSQPTPSQFCHICSRRPDPEFPHFKCGNLLQASCRKVICHKCFEKHKWDKEAVRNAGAGEWLCTHCRDECPPYAQCAIYNRTSKRRRLNLINHRKKKSSGGEPVANGSEEAEKTAACSGAPLGEPRPTAVPITSVGKAVAQHPLAERHQGLSMAVARLPLAEGHQGLSMAVAQQPLAEGHQGLSMAVAAQQPLAEGHQGLSMAVVQQLLAQGHQGLSAAVAQEPLAQGHQGLSTGAAAADGGAGSLALPAAKGDSRRGAERAPKKKGRVKRITKRHRKDEIGSKPKKARTEERVVLARSKQELVAQMQRHGGDIREMIRHSGAAQQGNAKEETGNAAPGAVGVDVAKPEMDALGVQEVHGVAPGRAVVGREQGQGYACGGAARCEKRAPRVAACLGEKCGGGVEGGDYVHAKGSMAEGGAQGGHKTVKTMSEGVAAQHGASKGVAALFAGGVQEVGTKGSIWESLELDEALFGAKHEWFGGKERVGEEKGLGEGGGGGKKAATAPRDEARVAFGVSALGELEEPLLADELQQLLDASVEASLREAGVVVGERDAKGEGMEELGKEERMELMDAPVADDDSEVRCWSLSVLQGL